MSRVPDSEAMFPSVTRAFEEVPRWPSEEDFADLPIVTIMSWLADVESSPMLWEAP